MRIGVFADTHDHLDHLRAAIEQFNQRQCDLVLFAGDFVSTFAIPPLRKLRCRMYACFGDNEGNKLGIRGGMQIIGQVGDPPFGLRLVDGTRILLTHQRELLRGDVDGAQVVVYAHTHKPKIAWDEAGRLWVNPGETSGWTYGRPTIALLETQPLSAEIVDLPTGVRRTSSPSNADGDGLEVGRT